MSCRLLVVIRTNSLVGFNYPGHTLTCLVDPRSILPDAVRPHTRNNYSLLLGTGKTAKIEYNEWNTRSQQFISRSRSQRTQNRVDILIAYSLQYFVNVI